MRIPRWLLKLLQIWDYVCPKCQENVPKNSRECPHCGERYPLPLKLPPSILKDKKALEDYVHRVVFPKVSSEYRMYLTQFFTVLFSDGFESGNFNAWTSTSGSPTVETNNPHHGTYNAKFTTPTTGGVLAQKTITPSSIAHMRIYAKISALPQTNTSQRLMSFYNAGSASSIAHFYIVNINDQYFWRFTLKNNGVAENFDSVAVTIQTNRYYCIELYEKIHATAGEGALCIDGVNVASASGKDTDNQGNIVDVYIGALTSSSSNYTVHMDCVVVSDAYIGIEPGETLQTVTDSLSLSDSALRHKPLLPISDSATLTEAFSRGKTFTLIDSLNLAETEHTLKELLIHDASSLADAASTVLRVLQVSESVSVAEVVQVGASSVRKTKLFLILGDLALQLTGD